MFAFRKLIRMYEAIISWASCTMFHLNGGLNVEIIRAESQQSSATKFSDKVQRQRAQRENEWLVVGS